MEEKHRSVLRKHRTYIVNNLSNSDLNSIVDYLIEKGLLTDNMGQDILEAENTAVKRTRALLDIVPRRGPTAFNMFCNALMLCKLHYMAERLDPSFVGAMSETALPQSTAGSDVKPSIPVPVQTGSSFGKKAAVVPMSISIQPGSSGAAGSQPTPDKEPVKYMPSVGRQISNEIEKTYPPSDEQEEFIADDWPKNLNMAPFGSSDFTLKPCNQAELKTQLQLIDDEQVYPVTSFTRGRALIINNIHYDDIKIAERYNSDNDSTRIQMALSALKFKVVTRANVTLEVLHQELKKETMFDQPDAFILVILSYGGNGTVLCTDGKEMAIQDIVNMFSSARCPSLVGKPKMFFIQACGVRLKEIDKKDFARSDSTRSMDSVIQGLESLNLIQPVDEDFPDTTPGLYPQADTSDMLVAVATSPDADCKGGAANSIFMLGLAYILCNRSRNKHLLQQLKMINTLKKDPDSKQPVQLCEVRESLTKKVYFFPGYVAETSNHEEDFQSFGSSKPID